MRINLDKVLMVVFGLTAVVYHVNGNIKEAIYYMLFSILCAINDIGGKIK